MMENARIWARIENTPVNVGIIVLFIKGSCGPNQEMEKPEINSARLRIEATLPNLFLFFLASIIHFIQK